jgi:hypothetical protein
MKTALVVLAIVAASAAAPLAAAPQIPPELERACRADYQRLCRGVFPGGGRILQCLRDKAAQVSDPCKAAIAKAEQDGTLPAR